MTTAALIVAAGRGSRAGTVLGPKQYRLLGNAPVICRTLRAFLDHSEVDYVLAVIHPDDTDLYRQAAGTLSSVKLGVPVLGGSTRQASVLAGLDALERLEPDRVLIHDAARPFITTGVVDRVLAGLATASGAIAALPLSDTLKRTDLSAKIIETPGREGLWRAQTPQGFNYREILQAHRRAATQGLCRFTDDAAVAEWSGLRVTVVQGSEDNIKLTTREDFEIANRLMLAAYTSWEPRTGTGFDVHRFCKGDHVWLCGVRIPHTRSLEGHSDADVALHALTDAILGALGDGDIGQHFPPTDAKWKGAASEVFLRDAASRVVALKGRISNVDVTLLCEAPRIGPHREGMRQIIGQILDIDSRRVGVKATTTEGLGFTGRGEGIAAMASATILLPLR